jgi:hypothetical protein
MTRFTKQMLVSNLLWSCAAPLCIAQTPFYFEITPHVGYRWGGTLDITNQPTAALPNVTPYNRLSVQGSSSYGAGGGLYLGPAS